MNNERTMRTRVISILVLVFMINSLVVSAEDVSGTINLQYKDHYSVEYRFDRERQQWEFNGALSRGWYPVATMSFLYSDRYESVSKSLINADEKVGILIFKNLQEFAGPEIVVKFPVEASQLPASETETAPPAEASSDEETETATTEKSKSFDFLTEEAEERNIITVDKECGDDPLCTIVTVVIREEKKRNDQSVTPPDIFVNGKTHEPFWNGKEWDYCAGEGCSEIAVTKLDHAAITGEETIILDPHVNEIGVTGYYIDELGIIYSCPEATANCIADRTISNQVSRGNDYQESLAAAKEKAQQKAAAAASPPQPKELAKTLSAITKINQEVGCFYNPELGDCKEVLPKTADEAYTELNSLAIELEKGVEEARSQVQQLGAIIQNFPPPGTAQSPEDLDKEAKIRREYREAKDDLQKKQQEAHDYRKAADSIRWKGSWLDNWKKGDAYKDFKKIYTTVNSVGLLVQSLGSYQALSNVIFPDLTQSFIDATNLGPLNAWANLPGYAAQKVCESDDEQRSAIPGQSAAYVRTAAGTYQFVGVIHAEKSTHAGPILCQKRAAAEEDAAEFFCKGNLVCKDDGFCYQHKDALQPVTGNFYKIVWGVTAPSDEKSTPYVDEDGKAVKFNLQLVGGNNRWLYKRGQIADAGVRELTNGARDGETIIHFSEHDYSGVCIRFDQRYRVKDYFGGDVKEICAQFVETDRGAVEFAGSDRTTPRSSAAVEVSLDTDW